MPTMTFEESLILLYQAPTNDYDAIQSVHSAWAALTEGERAVEQLYDFYFQTIDTLLTAPSADRGIKRWVPKSVQNLLGAPSAETLKLHAYQFIVAFSSSQYLESWCSKRAAQDRLMREHSRHLELIQKALEIADHLITDKPLHGNTGKWGDIVASMLSLYSQHLGVDETSSAARAQAASLAYRFFRTYPDQSDIFITSYLAKGPEPLRDTAELLRFYWLQGDGEKGGPVEQLALDMLGIHAEKSDFFHKNAAEILKAVMADISTWPESTASGFLMTMVLKPLHQDTLSRQQALETTRSEVERRVELIARLSPDAAPERKDNLQRYLEDGKAELAKIEASFEEWDRKRKAPGLQRISVSATTRKALKVVAELLPPSQRATVEGLLDQAAEFASRPKKFPIPKASDNPFADIGLKLLVIEELMYRQRLLTPVFDVHEFAKEFDKREISVESDGYEVIPEVLQYFRNLPIPAELLAKVEKLHQSSGLDGGADIVYQIHPFWDPGVGDGPFKITRKAITDLVLLPNLRQISGLENSKPSRELLKALEERGIGLIEEDAE